MPGEELSGDPAGPLDDKPLVTRRASGALILRTGKESKLQEWKQPDGEIVFPREVTAISIRNEEVEGGLLDRVVKSLDGNYSFTELDISNNKIGPKAMARLGEALSDKSSLVRVSLERALIGPHGAMHIGLSHKWKVDGIMVNCGSLTQLELAGNNLGDEGVKYIAQALVGNCSCISCEADDGWRGVRHDEGRSASSAFIKRLGLSSNDITDQGVEMLADALALNKSVVDLDLGWNRLTQATGAEVAKLIRKESPLEKLNLEHNELEAKGAMSLFAALKDAESPKITHLNLSHNNVTNRGVEALGAALKGLEYLNLAGNNLGPAGATAIAQSMNAHGVALRRLILDDNHITDQGAIAIADEVKKLTMEEFSADYNNIGIRGRAAVEWAFEKTLAPQEETPASTPDPAAPMEPMPVANTGPTSFQQTIVENDAQAMENVEQPQVEQGTVMTQRQAQDGQSAADALALPGQQSQHTGTQHRRSTVRGRPGKRGTAAPGAATTEEAGDENPDAATGRNLPLRKSNSKAKPKRSSTRSPPKRRSGKQR